MTRFKKALMPAISVLLLFVVWQLAVLMFKLPTYILPGPVEIFGGIWDQSDKLGSNITVTLGNTLIGFVIGTAIGLGLAVVMVLSGWIYDFVMPVAVAISSVPTAAFVPLALIWFGMGDESKIAMAALAVSFAVLLNAVTGLQSSPRDQVNLLRSFGASRFKVLLKLQLPAAMPSIMTGMRVGLSRATITVIVTEMLGAYSGIGQVIYQATSVVDYVTVWAAVLVASAGSLVLYGLLAALDARLVWWR
ncbi:ABC transporter permease [Pseudooceanicola sp. CBS1P-1]|uniref:ABC transporter permease subunit n=1 Tax=Pseudooceanicola albus TaxID=2692189 RepID=A0A6L7G5L1_9RHOB|nr:MULTISPECIES: ABC transporter permease [Pseudooceanicola]MBT9385067.1 ABC transporter permease [Pseudooceanicola endophyticus]MXN18640.1 ABC transporter permease subunit [Pseudooceanicola albus]